LYPPPNAASAGQAFAWIDRYLDTTRHGPAFLLQPEVAQVVVDTLHRGSDNNMYKLRAYVVMSNHVHVLLRPLQSASRVLQWLKGVTAREANQILGRAGKPFWQRESYDHWVRDDMELGRITAYIENNPVKAGYVAQPEQYPWSSAGGLKSAAAR
jgi:REP element-mobilizing transposase RayT